jgi:hypothetical protein
MNTTRRRFSAEFKFQVALDAAKGQPYPHPQLQSMAEKMKSEGAILVYFGELNRSTLPTENELKAELPLQPLIQTAAGAIFGISSNLADIDAESAEE